jgi:putative aldouronate transport system substrate-binding protein
LKGDEMMKKQLLKSIAVVLLLSIIVACTNQKPSNDSDGSSDNNSNSGDTPTIKFLVNEHPSWPTNKDWLVWEQMEKGGNINLDVTIGAEPYPETVNLTIASGDLPDLIQTPNYMVGNKYGQQGAFVNILDYLDQMPNLKAWMADFPEDARRALSADGKMFVTPNKGIGETNRMLWLYREDIFKKHGLEIPQNWDELYSVSKELKELYPDSYPFGFRNGTGKIRNLAPNFGTNWDYYYDHDNNDWKYGPIEDNYKVMLEYLNKFYKEGLIPPDWLTIETDQWQQLIANGTSFITQDYIGRIDMFNITNREVDPEFTLINMPPPAGFPGGKQQDFSAHTLSSGYSVAITSENKEAVLRYIDWTFSEEGRDALSWGVEGETYTVENGTKKFIKDYPSPSELRSETGLSLFGTYTWFDYDAHMSLFSDEVKQAYETDGQYDAPLVPEPAFTDAEQEKLSIQGESILKHRDEEVAKFILGERDFSEWDEFVSEMKDLGVEEMTMMYAEAHKRMLEADIN